jgi:hypothetical protein
MIYKGIAKMNYDAEEEVDFKVSFTLDEIRGLVLKELPKAQDLTNEYSLSNIKTYEIYHKFIEEFFKRNKFRKPSNADALAYIVLLSYSKSKITEATSFDDFCLFTEDSKDTDFAIVDTIDATYNEFDEQEIERYDCICSRKRLQKIFKVENRTTGIKLCIGCECIKKSRLVPEEDLVEKKKEMDEKRKMNKDRKRELEEGKPLGYYKQQKEEAKKQKIEEKELKKLQKQQTKLRKEQDKLNSGDYRRCYGCDSSLICIRKNRDIRFCDNCSCQNRVTDAIVTLYKKTYECNNCANCELSFVSRKSEDKYLCKQCECDKKMSDCRWCHTLFVDQIHSLDQYCDICTGFMVKCIDCTNEFKSTQHAHRCSTCQYLYDNTTVIVCCETCKGQFARKQKDSWRKMCSDCHLSKKTETKICDSCHEEFPIHSVDKWKTICRGCFKREIKKVNCVTCKKEFKKLPNESWKTMCYVCYLDNKK